MRKSALPVVLVATFLLGAHCPPRKSDGSLQQLAYVVDDRGARGTAVVDGEKREASASSVEQLFAELRLPGEPDPEVPCVALEAAGEAQAPTEFPGSGGVPSPWPDEAKYPGSSRGGCGTFAALLCDDILDGQRRPITPERWRRVHAGIGESATGGSQRTPTNEYHRKRIDGCYREELLKPGDADVINLLKAKHCDCKVWMLGPHGGHVEVITGVTVDPSGRRCLQTNSWGQPGLVCGQDQANGDQYSHSQDNPTGTLRRGTPNYPPGGTRVHWSCVCPRGNCT